VSTATALTRAWCRQVPQALTHQHQCIHLAALHRSGGEGRQAGWLFATPWASRGPSSSSVPRAAISPCCLPQSTPALPASDSPWLLQRVVSVMAAPCNIHDPHTRTGQPSEGPAADCRPRYNATKPIAATVVLCN